MPEQLPRKAAAFCLLLLWWLPWLPPLWQMLFPETECPISDPGVGVTNTSRTQIAILAMAALALSGWRPSLGNRRSPGLWIGAFLGWTVLASLAGGDPLESLFFAQGWLAAACVLLCAPSLLPANPGFRWRAAVIHGPAIVGGLICLAPMLYAQSDYRAAGPFQLPGALATWLILVLPMISVELMESSKKALPLAILSAALSVTTLALTISRAAWLVAMLELALLMLLLADIRPRALLRWAGFGAGGVLLLLFMRHSFSGFGLLAAVAILCLIPVLATLPKSQPALAVRLLLVAVLAVGLTAAIYPDQSLGTAASKRLSTLTASDDSANGRVEFWRAALALSLKHPVLGVGPSRFSESYPLVQRYYYYFSDSAHGAVVEGLAELGWVGVVLFALALGMVLKATSVDPWSHPRQRAPLVGLLMGALYSQVEVGYHFAYLWVTGAFLLVMLQTGDPRPAARETRKLPLWAVPVLTIMLSAFFLQRAVENSVRQVEAAATYQQARRVSEMVPFWPKPTLTALSYGLRSNLPLDELDPLLGRAISYAKADSVSYQLAGEIAMQRKNYAQARALFGQALRLDKFNHPGSYQGLLMVASATGDRALADRVTTEVLATYDLERGWSIAHTGHKQKLALELRPLLYDIADSLSPYKEPQRTEPIYRFLVNTGGEARGLYGLGIALQTQGKVEEGRRFLQQAHDKDPVYPAP